VSARVITGDCLHVMPTLDADSFDAIVCDPPYGLGFMGKAWDHGVPGVAFWKEALRVAKPGAHLAAFGGTRTYHRLTVAIEDAGWEIRDCLSWLYGSGFPKSHNGPWGGTALKPAWEPIILARKPLGATVEATHAKHGTGALNITDCRIGSDEVQASGAIGNGWRESEGRGDRQQAKPSLNVGRWPANVCLDSEAAALLDEQSGDLGVSLGGGMKRDGDGNNVYGMHTGHAPVRVVGHGDSGGASRFFYTAKASRAERNAGLDGGTQRQRDEQRDPDLPGGNNPRNRGAKLVANHHPTVKPLDLMQWLCRLVTPKGGLILDPFTGSGSTGRAAVAEGFRFVGIELSEEYATIARARIADYAPLFNDGAA
jgi:DNA modification methylase